jgi:transposase
MHKKQNYIYVGIDLHKETHTALIINCWNEKLGQITFDNKASDFKKLTEEVQKHNNGLIPVYGLENAGSYGRNLAIYLLEQKQIVKDVNPSLPYAQRMSSPTTKKDDGYDASCIANVLLYRLDELPDACPNDAFWTLAQLVNRRESIVIALVKLKTQLHEQLAHSYSSYKKFFSLIDTKTALNFWELYPSPQHLKDVTMDKLAEILRKTSHNNCSNNKAQKILDTANNDGEIAKGYQEVRDFITRSIVRDIRSRKEELKIVEEEICKLMETFGYKLETMPGIDTMTAAKLVAEIGDINRFPNADKLARYSGIAPSFFGSGGKGKEQKSKQGNRRLYGIFYFLGVQMVQTAQKSGKPRNAVFHEYFKRKISEGKTKPQALVCVIRRLVNIIYGMLKNKTEYREPELPIEKTKAV